MKKKNDSGRKRRNGASQAGAKGWRRAFSGLAVFLAAPGLKAGPAGATVTSGKATITTQGPQTTIQTSGNTVINWQSFNIGLGQSVIFQEPSRNSVVWNWIGGGSPSQILGDISANGLVILQNPSGFYIGGQAHLNAPGLVITAAPGPPPDLSGKGEWNYSAPPPTASIVNYGQINIGKGGSAYLIANQVENDGTISAPSGNIGLYAGKHVEISSRPDGRGLSADVTLPAGSVDNNGKLIADAGSIMLNARVVNDGGLIQANSIGSVSGSIQLLAGDAVNLGPGADLEATGSSQGVSAGGNVVVKSGNTYSDTATSVINAAGGSQGGVGGQIEISAPQLGAMQAQASAPAAPGWLAGELSIDPANITLSSTGATPTSGTVGENSAPPNGTLILNPAGFTIGSGATAAPAFSQILLQASQNITIASPWTIPASADPTSTLTLQAGKNITINTGDSISLGKNWTLDLVAGADFSSPNSVTPGAGSLALNGTAFVQTVNGNINVTAGSSVTLGAGAIRTTGGGSINVLAASGNVNSGTGTDGYVFNTTATAVSPYSVNASLSGISTEAGGNVTISAPEGNVTSLLPGGISTASQTDAGSGSFGPEPGNVTITAGGSVFGHYVEANGTGTITAGGNVGSTTPTQQLALSLIDGGWNVTSETGNIYLQEVRNPNGALNQSAHSTPASDKFFHVFDYAPDSYLDLAALNGGVFFLGENLPRVALTATAAVTPIILPPSLDIQAGSGGIEFNAQTLAQSGVTLYPSPDGQLNISTTGSVNTGVPGQTVTLAMSDAAGNQWTGSDINYFSDNHAQTPVHLNDMQPAVINVGGTLQDVDLIMAKETQLNVGGNANNVSFYAQNLHPTDTTSITVGGSIINPANYTFVTLTTAQAQSFNLAAYLNILQNAVEVNANGGLVLDPNGNPIFLIQPGEFPSIFYLPGTMQLGFINQMSLATEQSMLNSGQPFHVLQYQNGLPATDAAGNFLTVTTASPLPASVVQALYAVSQTAAQSQGQGFAIAGPGHFDLTAGSIDLGSSAGIYSLGPGQVSSVLSGNPALANLGPGADININISTAGGGDGNLTMLSSTIGSLFGGAINLNAGGSINIGSGDLAGLTASGTPVGIWTSGNSDINIKAQGDVDVNGSRVATYNGGNISIESLNGNVDAGSGGNGIALVPTVAVDPATGNVTMSTLAFGGSGILALTAPTAPQNEAVGNITINTPNGSIDADQGGILQVPLNGNNSALPVVTLDAGKDVNLGQSGVLGGNVNVNAGGSVEGLVFARNNTSVVAVQSFTGTIVAGGTANVSASTTSGNVIAGGAVTISGQSTATIITESGATVGGSSAQTAAPTSVATSTSATSAAAQQSNVSQNNTQTVAANTETNKAPTALIAKSNGRVTVILPAK